MLRPLLLITVVLLVPIVPFVIWGAALEAWTEAWVADPPRKAVAGATMFALLASDLLLPVPASVVSTFAGSLLGWAAGTLVGFAGTSVGAIVGFTAARLAHPWVARRIETSIDHERVRDACDRYGEYVIVVARPLPVLAEASVLLVGLQGMRWSRFLPALLLSNLGLAAGYALLGVTARDQQWLPVALALSAVVPLAVAAVARRAWSRPPPTAGAK